MVKEAANDYEERYLQAEVGRLVRDGIDNPDDVTLDLGWLVTENQPLLLQLLEDYRITPEDKQHAELVASFRNGVETTVTRAVQDELRRILESVEASQGDAWDEYGDDGDESDPYASPVMVEEAAAVAILLDVHEQNADRIHEAMVEIRGINRDIESHGVDIWVDQRLAQGANDSWSDARVNFRNPRLMNGAEKPMCDIKTMRLEDIVKYLRFLLNGEETRPADRPLVVNISSEALTNFTVQDILDLSKLDVKIVKHEIPPASSGNVVTINPEAVVAIDLCIARIKDFDSLATYGQLLINAYRALTSIDISMDDLVDIYKNPDEFVKKFTLTFPEVERNKANDLKRYYDDYIREREAESGA